MSKSKKMLNKVIRLQKEIDSDPRGYVINLTRKDIWVIADALRTSNNQMTHTKQLVKDFEKFEQKIAEYLNKGD